MHFAGAPHVHSLLWLKNELNEDAPSFWVQDNNDKKDEQSIKENLLEIERFVDSLITTSSDDIYCDKHSSNNEEWLTCNDCIDLVKRVDRYQEHAHTFTCEKRMKTITIKSDEGHGRRDGLVEEEAIENVRACRFKFPRFPSDETKVVLALSKDEDEKIVIQRRKDLRKLSKFLIRQTFYKDIEVKKFEKFQSLDFWAFLFEAGMFENDKSLHEYSEDEKQKAKERYYNAISASVKGSAVIVLKRKVKDIFINGYNCKIMRLHKTNMDIQVVVDPYGAGQYTTNYITKNEAAQSKLLKAVNDETLNLSQMERLNALSAVLDKHRECGIQEAIYRLLGLSMTKSSVKVKFLSTIHPNHRDGLLKGKLEDLDSNESIFHNSPHEYYEARPQLSDDAMVEYADVELEEDYWENLSLAEFWSWYEIVYKKENILKEGSKTTLIRLQNKKGFIRRRTVPAILRYYLNASNDEDLARGLLILFKPFRNEFEDIHRCDVKSVLADNRELIAEKRAQFEKYQTMLDLITSIEAKAEDTKESSDAEDDNVEEIESTAIEDIEEFEKWAKDQASKDLSKFKNLTNICDMDDFRTNISSLTQQQRLLFDDFVERLISPDLDEKPIFLFLSGT